MDSQFNGQQTTINNTNTNGGNAPGYMLWLILGIVQVCSLCCCSCTTPIFGIITIVFVCQANNLFKNGNIAMFQSKLKVAKIVNIVGWALCIVWFVISIACGIFSEIAEQASMISY